jgi:hypothetical protein
LWQHTQTIHNIIIRTLSSIPLFFWTKQRLLLHIHPTNSQSFCFLLGLVIGLQFGDIMSHFRCLNYCLRTSTANQWWSHSLRHELSSLTRTLGLWFWIPLKDMDVCVCIYSVSVLSCVQVVALRWANHSPKESYRLRKKDNETEEEARAQQRAVEPLMIEWRNEEPLHKAAIKVTWRIFLLQLVLYWASDIHIKNCISLNSRAINPLKPRIHLNSI